MDNDKGSDPAHMFVARIARMQLESSDWRAEASTRHMAVCVGWLILMSYVRLFAFQILHQYKNKKA
jgi:hypothetical protein